MAGRAKNTLSDQIRKTIGFRILVCISLYLVFFIAITAYDFSRGMTQVESRVKGIAAQLDEYVISQILINNDQSIKVKLKEEALHNDMIISWDKSDQLSSKNIKWSFPMGWSYKSEISTLDGRHYGALVFKGSFFNDKGFMFEMLVRVSFLILFLIFMLVILYPLSLKIPKTLFVDPLLSLLSLLKTPETYKANSSVIMRTSELKQIEESILYLLEKTKKDSRNAAIGQIASQVAHDIRSPLAALNVLMEQNHQMKQDQVQLLQHTIKL